MTDWRVRAKALVPILLSLIAVALSGVALRGGFAPKAPEPAKFGAWIDDIGGAQLKRSGTVYPKRKYINVSGAEVVDNSAAQSTDLTFSGGTAAAGVADLTALRALTSSQYADKQLRATGSPSRMWRYDAAATGTDDGNLIVKPNDVSGGSPGRWLSIGASGVQTASDLAALRAVAAALRYDGQQIAVGSPVGTWIFSSSTGSGFADDGLTVVKPTDVLLASNGRWYPASPQAVLPTIAALRAAVAGKQSVLHVQAYSTIGDTGGGDFEYDASDTTSADNTGTVVVAGTRRYKRRFTGALHVEWFGVKADGNIVEDGVMNNGSDVLTSATAKFTAADVGKTILIDAPSNPAAGTATTVAGSRAITGAGTAWLTDFAAQYAIYLSSEGLNSAGAFLVISDTSLYMNWPAVSSGSGITLYRKVQQLATITSLVSATQVHTSFTAVLGQILIRFSYGNDQTTAMQRAIATAIAEHRNIEFGPGYYGFTANQSFVGAHGMRISGHGMNATELFALIPYDSAVSVAPDYGLLSFRNSSGIEVEDLALNYSCPFVAIVNSNTLGQKATYFHEAPNCRVRHVRAVRCRDECIYADGNTTINWEVSHCVVDSIGSAVNLNSAAVGSEGMSITSNTVRCTNGNAILASSKSGFITGNDISGPQPAFLGDHVRPSGADLVALETAGRMMVANNVFRDADTTAGGVSALKMFGVSVDATSVISVLDNTFTNILADWADGDAAAISASIFEPGESSVEGVLTIQGNTFRKCRSANAGGKFVHVDGPNTSHIVVLNNDFSADASSQMTIGIDLDADVPEGAAFAHGNLFSPVTTTLYDPKVVVLDGSRSKWLGDSNSSIAVSGGNLYVLPPNTLTSNRSDTLDTTGAVTNEVVTIERQDRTNKTLAVVNGGAGAGTPYTFPASKQRRATFKFDGTNWSLLSTEAFAVPLDMVDPANDNAWKWTAGDVFHP